MTRPCVSADDADAAGSKRCKTASEGGAASSGPLSSGASLPQSRPSFRRTAQDAGNCSSLIAPEDQELRWKRAEKGLKAQRMRFSAVTSQQFHGAVGGLGSIE